MTKPWLNLSIVVGLVFMLAVSGCADYQAGLDAYNRGDYDTALKELRPLAEQGHAEAQYNLGYMYYKGQGLPQNYIQAYMWASLAAGQGYELAAKGLEILEKEMTPAQIAEAQRLAREWKAKGKN